MMTSETDTNTQAPNSAPAVPGLDSAVPGLDSRPAQQNSKPALRFFQSCFSGCLMACFWICLAFLALAIVAFRGCRQLVKSNPPEVSYSLLEESASKPEKYAVSYDPYLMEMQGVKPEKDAPVILILSLSGVMTLAESESVWELNTRGTSSSEVLKAIRKATYDSSIDGILLQMDTPGGDVTTAELLWKALKEFRSQRANRSVTVLTGAMCCSGGYYMAVAADHIIALPTSILGSIGVKLESVNIRQLAEKLGIRPISITSGENKNMLSPFEDLTPEQEQLLRNMIRYTYDGFVVRIAEGRNRSQEKIRAVADGRILTAPDALNAGLIDQIGYLEDAAQHIRQTYAAGKSVHWVHYRAERSWQNLFSPELFGTQLRRVFLDAVNAGFEETAQLRLKAQ